MDKLFSKSFKIAQERNIERDMSSSTPTQPKIKITFKVKKPTVIDVKNQFIINHEPMRVAPTLCVPYANGNPKSNIDLWSEKYRPKTLLGLVGNSNQIREICEWFKRFKSKDSSIKRSLLFSGCPGTSKTTVAHIVMHEFGYDVKEYNASDVRNKVLVEENLNRLVNMDQVDRDSRKDFHPFGIIMDEVDGMSSGDKGGMLQLIKTINPARGKNTISKVERHQLINRWIPPIICICNNNYDKKIKELKKDCLEIKFDKPNITQLCAVIDNICKQEHLNMTSGAKKYVAELSQGDFRRLVFLLQNFSNIKRDEISVNDLCEYYEVIGRKTLDLNSYEITDKIFQEQTKIDDILKLYETDKSLLPMMVHENYLDMINAQHTSIDNKLDCCISSMESIATGDIIEKIMYNTQSWYLQPIHGLASCYIPHYYANQSKIYAHPRIEWTSTLSKFSYQRANIKNINNISSLLGTGHSYTIEDIQLLSQLILFNLLDPKGNPQIGISYMKNYNLRIDDLEKLIKVDKLSDKYRNLYTSRQKTNLNKLYGNVNQLRREVLPMSYQMTHTATKYSLLSKKHDDSNDDDGENENDDI